MPHIDDYVELYAVKNIYEAKLLSLCTQKDILILMPPKTRVEDINNNSRFIYTVEKSSDLEFISNTANVKVHIKINTGMNRFGVDRWEELKSLIDKTSLYNIEIDGVYTHLYSSDYDDCQKQISRFFDLIANTEISKKKKHITYKHTLNKTDYLRFDFVRSGIDVLGCGNTNKQVLELSASVVCVRRIKEGETVGYDKTFIAENDCYVAIVNFGYNNMAIKKIDGQKVLINNRFYPIISVAMDVMFVLVDDNVKENDVVVITSDVDGIRLCDYAKNIKTCPHELLTSLKTYNYS